MSCFRSCKTIFLAALLTTATPTSADIPSSNILNYPEQSLGSLRQKITATEKSLRLAQQKYRKSQTRLVPRDKLPVVVMNNLHSLREKIDANTRRLTHIHSRHSRTSDQLVSRYPDMTRELISLILTGTGGAIREIIRGHDAANIVKRLAYHDYLQTRKNTYFHELIQLHKDKESMEDLADRVTQYNHKLENDYLKELDFYLERQQIQHKQQKRLVAYINDQRKQINQLFDQERSLIALLHQQRRLPAGEKQPGAVEVEEQIKERFTALRGRLNWPVGGVVHNLFDQQAPGSSVTPWKGVFIQQQRGQPVKAISDGRVLYADEFKSMGNLMILDHGEGYMSLYAHNENLRLQPGDWVSRGDTIASIGAAGNNDQVGLYFEIRHQGDPVDPTLWCN